MSADVKKNKAGHIKIKLNARQFMDFIEMLDRMPQYHKNSQYTVMHRVWMIVLQKLKDRYNGPWMLEEKMNVTLRLEEAVIVNHFWTQIFYKSDLCLKAEMMELNRLLLD